MTYARVDRIFPGSEMCYKRMLCECYKEGVFYLSATVSMPSQDHVLDPTLDLRGVDIGWRPVDTITVVGDPSNWEIDKAYYDKDGAGPPWSCPLCWNDVRELRIVGDDHCAVCENGHISLVVYGTREVHQSHVRMLMRDARDGSFYCGCGKDTEYAFMAWLEGINQKTGILMSHCDYCEKVSAVEWYVVEGAEEDLTNLWLALDAPERKGS